MPPLLSIVIAGRNDNYMGNYQWRVATSLNLLLRSITALGCQHQVEVVFCDWNSDVPFYRTLPLLSEAKDIVRFVIVPPEVATRLQGDSRFAPSLAFNVGIRNARGTYIVIKDADVVLTSSALDSLLKVLSGRIPLGAPVDKCFMTCHRRQLPVSRTFHNPPIEEVEMYLQRNLSLLQRDALLPGLAAPSAMQLMHRDLWNDAQGLDERFLFWGWSDIHLVLRLTQMHRWIDLSNFGVEAVHIEHYSSGGRQSSPAPQKTNGFPVSGRVSANDRDWGLGRLQLETYAPEVVLDEATEAQVAEAAVKTRSGVVDAETIWRDMQSPEIADLVSAFQPILPESMDPLLLLAIAWYAKKRHPRTFVEIGVQRSNVPGVVISGCPTCESYLIDEWSDDHQGGDPPIYHAANLAAAAHAQAQIHFITSAPTTALDRLFCDIAPELVVDLTLLRTAARYGDAIRNAAAMAEHLAPGGAVAVFGSTEAEFSPVWNMLTSRFPASARLQVRGATGEIRAGFLLNVVLPNSG